MGNPIKIFWVSEKFDSELDSESLVGQIPDWWYGKPRSQAALSEAKGEVLGTRLGFESLTLLDHVFFFAS